jgi:hypothetical protein
MNALEKLKAQAASGKIEKSGKGLPLRTIAPIEFAPAMTAEEFWTTPLASSEQVIRARRNGR